LKAHAGAFDIRVRAFSRFLVLTDEAASLFEQFLDELESVMAANATRLPDPFLPEGLYPTEVRRQLQQRKQYWLGRTLRRVRKHKNANRADAARIMGEGVASSEVKPRKPPPSAAAGMEPVILPGPRRGPEEGGAESVLERSKRRSAVVTPILASKKWTRGRWVARAGVSKNSVYEYLNGNRNLTLDNRQALAQVLGLKPEQLPD
jgi:hypothetical protein